MKKLDQVNPINNPSPHEKNKDFLSQVSEKIDETNKARDELEKVKDETKGFFDELEQIMVPLQEMGERPVVSDPDIVEIKR
jgi:hypothetical protein